MLIKIDGISSFDDAQRLRASGADILTISIETTKQADGLRSQLGTYLDDICFQFDLCKVEEDFCTNISSNCQLWGVDFKGHLLPSRKTFDVIKSMHANIVFSGIDASYDTDPSWILSRYQDAGFGDDAIYQIDFLDDIDNAWEFLKTETPKYVSELQICDIDEMCKSSRIIAAFDFSNESILEIVASLPNIQGIAMNIENRNGQRCYKVEDVERILLVIREGGI